jgi:hypothetical protein
MKRMSIICRAVLNEKGRQGWQLGSPTLPARFLVVILSFASRRIFAARAGVSEVGRFAGQVAEGRAVGAHDAPLACHALSLSGHL